MTAKTAVKQLGASMTGHLRRKNGRRYVILCYHSIHPTARYRDATPQMFEGHLQFLTERCEVMPLKTLLTRAAHGEGDPNDLPAVALTFDDGYEDQHSIALPILRDNGVTATFLVTTGFVGRDKEVLDHMASLRGVDVRNQQVLSWEQVSELATGGNLVGTHGYSHRNLAKMSYGAALEELSRSRDQLEQSSGIRAEICAYPFGKPSVHYNQATIRAAAASGYEVGLAVRFSGVEPVAHPLAVPRFTVFRDSRATLEAKVLGNMDFVGIWQERAPLPVRRLVSPHDFRL